MGTRLAGVATLIAAAVPAFGCGPDDEERTFDCDRGFRDSDWRDERLRTAQSVEKCGWFDGWGENRVLRALGRPSYRGRRYLTWDVDVSERGIGPLMWRLTIKQTGRHGPVKRATTRLGPY